MHVGAAVGQHQRLAQHAGAEVRNDDRHGRMLQRERRAGRADCRSGCRTGSAARASCGCRPTARRSARTRDRLGRAAAARCGQVEDPRDRVVVQRVAMHRREQADRAQALVERALSRRRSASSRVGSSMKKPTKRDGLARTAIATESASPGRLAISAALLHAVLVELGDPAIAPSASVESGKSQPEIGDRARDWRRGRRRNPARRNGRARR